MSSLLIQHKVADFAAWKKAYDEHESARTQAGATGARVFQSAEDPNSITAIIDFKDLSKAKAFIEAPELKAAMEKAGVTSPPTFHFLNQV